jgi:hypothetical protein
MYVYIYIHTHIHTYILTETSTAPKTVARITSQQRCSNSLKNFAHHHVGARPIHIPEIAQKETSPPHGKIIKANRLSIKDINPTTKGKNKIFVYACL